MKNTLQLLSLLLLVILISCENKETDIEKLEDSGLTPNNLFTHNPDGLHYVIIRLKLVKHVGSEEIEKPKHIQHGKLREALDQVNSEIWELKLRNSLIYLSGEEETAMEPIITVRRFENHQEAKAYSERLEKELITINGGDQIVEALPISQTNYRECLRKKSTKAYRDYYSKAIK